MSRLKSNILANLVGRIWTVGLSFAFIPFYLQFLGIEAYGLTGFFATLQSILGLTDLGLGLTLNREMARLSARSDQLQEKRDLLRTLEILYCSISILGGLAVVLLAGPISRHWINSQGLSQDTVETAIRLMGLAIAVQMPFSFYQGGLMGLQRQVLVNGILVSISTLRSVGAVLILWQVSATIEAFFVWQLLVSLAQTAITATCLWRSVADNKSPARFRSKLLQQQWRFTAAVSGNAMIGAVLTQLDKILLSKLLPLDQFGYYVLAGSVASVLWAIIIPVNTAYFPRFSQVLELHDNKTLARLYHQACQLVAAALLPVAVTIGLFSQEVVFVWTQNALTAEKTHLVVSLLIAGTAINGLVSVSGYLQAASGWPQLVMYSNLCFAVVLTPLTWFMATRFGPAGAACVWPILNCGYVLLTIPIMHRHLLKNEKWRWYWEDFGLPIAGSLTVGILCRIFAPVHASSFVTFSYLCATWLAMLLAVGLLASQFRAALLGYLPKDIFRRYAPEP